MICNFFRGLVSARLISVLLCVAFGSAVFVNAQRRNPLGAPTGFDDVVSAIAFSPDARTLAIARGASEPRQKFGRIELWDMQSGKLLHVIKGFDGPVKSVSFSPDGLTIVSASVEFRSEKIQQKAISSNGRLFGELKWWDTQTGELKHQITLPEGNANLKVIHSPNGDDLLLEESTLNWSYLPARNSSALPPVFPDPPAPLRPVMFFTAVMRVLDAQTGEQKLKMTSDGAGPVAYSPDGALIAAAKGSEVKLWNPQTGKEQAKLKGFKGKPNALAFSRDGQTLAVASMKFEREDAGDRIKVIGISRVKLIDIPTRRVIREVSDVGAVNTLAFAPNGHVLIMGGVMRAGEKDIAGIDLLDLETGKVSNLPTAEDYTEAVNDIAVSMDGALLAFRSGPTTVRTLDTSTWKERQMLDGNSLGEPIERPVSRFVLSVKRILAVAFSADGNTVAAETDQGEIKAWDPRTGEVRTQVKRNNDAPTAVAASADGRSFAELSDGKVLIWNSTNPNKQVVPLPEGRGISALALSPEGQTLALAYDKEVLLFNPAGSLKQKLVNQHGSVDGLIFSREGRQLACVTSDGTIEIWRVPENRLDKTVVAGSALTALAFGPDGATIATASADREITIWNVQTGNALSKLNKHDATINTLAFSPTGEFLASGGDDRTVVIWKVASGKSTRTLKGHDQTVTSLAFSPDGQYLASGGGNASVVVWELRTGKFTRVLK